MSTARWSHVVRVSALMFGLLVGCGESASESEALPDAGPGPGPGPMIGEDGEFLSAEGQPGQRSSGPGAADAAAAPASSQDSAGGKAERTVEEGDIYRVLAPGRLLNLNPYRGLQVVDISDVSKPAVIGKLRESGAPVEMYVVGQRAIVLLNNWTGYWGSRSDVKVEQQQGGLVLSVDLSNPTAPVVTDREFVPGHIQTSRLTREGGAAALYVAAQLYGCWGMNTSGVECTGTVVKSFDVSSPDMVAQSRIDLGGYVSAVQGTPNALIVARQRYDGSWPAKSQVSLIDISSASGSMREGGQVTVAGMVNNKYNLDVRNGFLRVVSTGTWGAGNTNYLQTYDARDLTQLKPAAECTFGAGQQLFATLFMEDRAFFVTYLRQDPFHAFALGADGSCQERTEFVVSGWNNFFRPVFDNQRLIGIGMNDQDGRTVAVSLYDVSDLDNKNPLLARAEVNAKDSWSSANWDDKAFSVLENAVSVNAFALPEQVETGLVLLPFAGYDKATNTGSAGVQIYTFSDRTLTRRGVMRHGALANRSFQPQANLTANLSDAELSLFDTANPDQPLEKGRVELAPSYTKVLDYGSHLVRVHDTRASYQGWWSYDAPPPPAYAEIIPNGGDPDGASAIARVSIPAGARTFKVGTLLVAVSTKSTYAAGGGVGQHRSTIRVYDLREPEKTVELSSLETERLLPAYGYGWGYRGGMTCGVMDGSWYYDDFSRVIGNAIVFGRNQPQQQSTGSYEMCWSNYYEPRDCRGLANCAWTEGSKNCARNLATNQTVCTGSFVRCTSQDAGAPDCQPIDESTLPVQKNCYTAEQYRYWQSMELDVLDLTDPRAPAIKTVAFAKEEEAEGLVATADSVYFAFKKPFVRSGDTRAYVKFYFRQVDVRDPKSPVVSAAVNVPGELLAVEGDRLITRDLRWGESVAESQVHTLQRSGDRVTLTHSVQFDDRLVKKVLPDGKGHLYVSHAPQYRYYGYGSGEKRPLDTLTIYNTSDLVKIGETDIDSWADMTQALDGRLVFGVGGGFLIVNAQSPATPYAQAFFPYMGYSENLTFSGNTILLAGGPFGIYAFDATTHNLLQK